MTKIRRRVGGRIIVQQVREPELPKPAAKKAKKTVKRKTAKKAVRKARKTR